MLTTYDVSWLPAPNGSFSYSFGPEADQDIPAFLVIPLGWKASTAFNFTDDTSIPIIALATFIWISTRPPDLGAILAADLCALSFCAQKCNVSVLFNQPSSTILQTVYGTEVKHDFYSSEADIETFTRWLSVTGDDFNMTFLSHVHETDQSKFSVTG